jgi:hypothetical protein
MSGGHLSWGTSPRGQMSGGGGEAFVLPSSNALLFSTELEALENSASWFN